ncbi:hypothetical protein ABG768_020018, partial [Culter alburnus]
MESTQPLYICISEENKEFLNSGEWDYGIVVTDLNPYVTKSELQSFFQTFGTITECNIKIDKSSGWPKGVGFVRYSSSKEAEAAQADGPHNLGGFPIWINRVVTPKETVAKLLTLSFKEDKTKVSSDAVILVAEMLKVFVEEATRRAVKQASSEDCDTVDIEHFEKILPQL